MKALFVTSGLELRILTDKFINNYFSNGIIISVHDNDKIKSFADAKNLTFVKVDAPDIGGSRLLYIIIQLQKIRLSKKTKSRVILKLPKKYNYFEMFNPKILSALFYCLDFLYRNFQKPKVWKELQRVYSTYGITEIIFASHNDRIIQSAAHSAIKNGISSFLIQNSWKDVFINPYLYVDFTKINVWSEAIANVLKELNTRTQNIEWKISWHPRLLKLTDSGNSPTSKDVPEKIILYTCANPKIIPDEYDIVKLILTECPSEYRFVIRPNPQDDKPGRWEKLIHFREGLSIDIPNWYWDQKVNIPEPNAEEHWRNLLMRCCLVIGVASTVTLEALLLNKKVLNIAFGSDGSESEYLREITYAPYYEGLLQHTSVYVCSNIKCFNTDLEFLINSNSLNEEPSQYLINHLIYEKARNSQLQERFTR